MNDMTDDEAIQSALLRENVDLRKQVERADQQWYKTSEELRVVLDESETVRSRQAALLTAIADSVWGALEGVDNLLENAQRDCRIAEEHAATLVNESAYWRQRAEEAEKKLADAAALEKVNLLLTGEQWADRARTAEARVEGLEEMLDEEQSENTKVLHFYLQLANDLANAWQGYYDTLVRTAGGALIGEPGGDPTSYFEACVKAKKAWDEGAANRDNASFYGKTREDVERELLRIVGVSPLDAAALVEENAALRAAAEEVLSWNTGDTSTLLSNPPQNAGLFHAQRILREALEKKP
jgi:hypothetical protein